MSWTSREMRIDYFLWIFLLCLKPSKHTIDCTAEKLYILYCVLIAQVYLCTAE